MGENCVKEMTIVWDYEGQWIYQVRQDKEYFQVQGNASANENKDIIGVEMLHYVWGAVNSVS